MLKLWQNFPKSFTIYRVSLYELTHIYELRKYSADKGYKLKYKQYTNCWTPAEKYKIAVAWWIVSTEYKMEIAYLQPYVLKLSQFCKRHGDCL